MKIVYVFSVFYYICPMAVRKDRLSGVKRMLSEELDAISDNIGITKSQLLRREIRQCVVGIVEKRFDDEVMPEMVISGIPDDVMEKLNIVCEDMNVSQNTFMKILCYQISMKFPPNMRQPNKGGVTMD